MAAERDLRTTSGLDDPTIEAPAAAWPTLEEPSLLGEEAGEARIVDAPRRDDRLGLGVLLGALLMLVVVLGALTAWLLTRDEQQGTASVSTRASRTASVETPGVVGLSWKVARLRLTEAGLRPVEELRATSRPSGTVLAQRPQAGANARRGSTVVVVVDGPGAKVRARVPDVRGLKALTAREQLDRLGFRVRLQTVPSGRPPGTVLEQRPASSERAVRGSAVVLTIAKPAWIVMPDVVGSNAATARATLEGRGLQVDLVEEVAATAPAGSVTAQHPAAGRRVQRGDSVRLSVASESSAATTSPATTTSRSTRATVPDLSASQLRSAAQELIEASLLASVQYVPGDDPLGTVLAQSPSGSTDLPTYAHVTLSVSRGPGDKPDVSVPSLVGRTLDEAVSAANGAGLRIFFLKRPVSTRADAGRVVEQTPKPGASAPRNAQVLVYLGAFRSS
jgi:beta-lactam-binding protein with PASTA domain